eukprot:s1267_g10.t5
MIWAVLLWLRTQYQRRCVDGPTSLAAAEVYVRCGERRYPFSDSPSEDEDVDERPHRPPVDDRLRGEVDFEVDSSSGSSDSEVSTTEPSIVTLSLDSELTCSDQSNENEALQPSGSEPATQMLAACSFQAGDQGVLVQYGGDEYWVPLVGWALDEDQDNPYWNKVSTTRSPPKRADAAAVMTNERRFWIFGGNGEGYIRIDDVWFINMQATKPDWVQVLPITVSGSPSARQFHSGLLTQYGDIFFTGGKGDQGVTTDVWYLVGVAANATAATTTSSSSSTSSTASNTTFTTTSSSSTSTTTTAFKVSLQWGEVFASGTPSARYHHSAVVDESGRMWMYGGYSNNFGNAMDDTWYVDLQESFPIWNQDTPNGNPGRRSRHASFIDGTGRMWIQGGLDGSSNVVGSLWVLDTQVSPHNWTEVVADNSFLPQVRDHSAVITNASQVYMYGGQSSCCYKSYLTTFNLQDPSMYYDMSGSISGTSPGARAGHTAALSSANRMWIFGGGTGMGSYYNDLRFVDLDDPSPFWTEVSPTGDRPLARAFHSAIFTTTERLWIFGGLDTMEMYLGDVWFIDLQDVSNPTFWVEVSSQTNPNARAYHTAVFAKMSEMWVFGGSDGSDQSDLWVLEASSPSWSRVVEKCCTTPTARVNHRSVFSADDQRMWIFGGLGGAGPSLLNELWYLDFQEDPPGWYPTAPSMPPSARKETSAVLSGTGQLWIYGGADSGNSVLSDLWYIDLPAAFSWTQLYPSGSAGSRRGHSAVLTAENVMWIFAGNDGGGDLSDMVFIDLQAVSPTWTWPSVMSSIPTARSRHEAALRHHTNKMWMFGGYTSSGNYYQHDLWSVDLTDPLNLYWYQTYPGANPPERADCSAVLTTTGRLWIWGGVNAGGSLEDLWVIDVDAYTPTWSEITTVTTALASPGKRTAHSAVLTPEGDMLTFGGSTAAFTGTPSSVDATWRLSSIGTPSTGSTTTTTTTSTWEQYYNKYDVGDYKDTHFHNSSNCASSHHNSDYNR